MSGVTKDETAKALVALATLDRKALAKQWTEVFSSLAPRHAQVALLRGALAWHYQIAHEANGEVDQLLRRLRRQAASNSSGAVLAPGTRLLREWQGQTYHVTVVADGFEYAGTTYKSLTAISRQITGTARSGPLFFGLRK
jgi:hypothetical protein